jgi:sulfate permease, SulP family
VSAAWLPKSILLHRSGRELILCGALPQPAALMHQAEFHDHVGERNICARIESALERAAEIHHTVFGPA